MVLNQELELLNNTEEDLEWFSVNSNNLKRDHNNKFVAIKDKKILVSDSNIKDVIKKIKEKNEDPSRILIKFVSVTPFIF